MGWDKKLSQFMYCPLPMSVKSSLELMFVCLLFLTMPTLKGIGSVRPNYTFALGPFALKVGPFALIIKKYFNEHTGYFNLK